MTGLLSTWRSCSKSLLIAHEKNYNNVLTNNETQIIETGLMIRLRRKNHKTKIYKK